MLEKGHFVSLCLTIHPVQNQATRALEMSNSSVPILNLSDDDKSSKGARYNMPDSLTRSNIKYPVKIASISRYQKKVLNSSFLTTSQRRHGRLGPAKITRGSTARTEDSLSSRLEKYFENSWCWGVFLVFGNVHREIS